MCGMHAYMHILVYIRMCMCKGVFAHLCIKSFSLSFFQFNNSGRVSHLNPELNDTIVPLVSVFQGIPCLCFQGAGITAGLLSWSAVYVG